MDLERTGVASGGQRRAPAAGSFAPGSPGDTWSPPRGPQATSESALAGLQLSSRKQRFPAAALNPPHPFLRRVRGSQASAVLPPSSQWFGQAPSSGLLVPTERSHRASSGSVGARAPSAGAALDGGTSGRPSELLTRGPRPHPASRPEAKGRGQRLRVPRGEKTVCWWRLRPRASIFRPEAEALARHLGGRGRVKQRVGGAPGGSTGGGEVVKIIKRMINALSSAFSPKNSKGSNLSGPLGAAE